MSKAYELTLDYCSNPECGERITIDNWEGGSWNGYPLCPECFKAYEAKDETIPTMTNSAIPTVWSPSRLSSSTD